MTINNALDIIYNHSEFNPNDTEWHDAFETITDQLGLIFDKSTEQFITIDTGDVI